MKKRGTPPTASKKEQLLIASGLVPLLFACKTQPNFLPLFYSLFVLAFFLSKKECQEETPCRKTLYTASMLFSLNLTLLGLLAEALALFNMNLNSSTLNQAPEVILPQLIAIASGGAGFYLGWALAVCIVGRIFGFSLSLALFSGLYPPLLALFPLSSAPNFNAIDISNPLIAFFSLSVNSWQILNPSHQTQDFPTLAAHGFISSTLAGLAYLSSFGQITTKFNGTQLQNQIKHFIYINSLRTIILLTLLMSILPWSLSWLFLKIGEAFKEHW